MKVLAVTSGKGGVGKSTLSLNIARQLSLAGRRVLLVDFDIHNKGISGLFLDLVTEETTNVNSIAAQSEGFAPQFAAALAESVHPVPVVSDGSLLLVPALVPRDKFEWKSFTAENSQIVRFFKEYFAKVAEKLKLDVVLIDCYGGVDSLTVAAAGIADDVIVVNEPDLITFTGTLLLYEYLKTTYPDPNALRIHFVINRITLKHSYRFLNAEYCKHLAPLTPDSSILAYFPFDQHVVDSFGEYPFFSELAPRGLFTRKVKLLIQKLWQDDSAYAHFLKGSKKRAGKVFTATTELRFAQPERIIVAVVSLPGWLVIPSLMLLALYAGIGKSLPYDVIVATIYTASFAILVLILLIGVVEPFLMTLWLQREARYRYGRDLLANVRRSTRYLQFQGRMLIGAVPGVFAFLLLMGLGGVLVAAYAEHFWNSSGRLVEIPIWPGTVSGFKPGGDYSGLHLNYKATISQRQSLTGTKFQGAELPYVHFAGLKLTDTHFENAVLGYAGPPFTPAFVESSGGSFVDCDLTTAHFDHAQLGGTTFSGSKLKASNQTFRNADLSGVYLPSLKNLRDAGATDLQELISKKEAEAAGNKPASSPAPKPEPKLSAQERLIMLAFVYRTDAIQDDIFLGTPGDLARARTELATIHSLLLRDTSGYHTRDSGEYLALSLLLSVRAGEPDSKQAAAWETWIRSNQTLPDFFAEWENRQAECVNCLPNEQVEKINLIEKSAKGEISADEFHREYQKTASP